jgi:predicted DNA-binding transcriptional regulator AlpA
MFQCTRKTLMSWVRAGKFPRPLKIGKRKLYWAPAELERVLLGQLGAGRRKRG